MYLGAIHILRNTLHQRFFFPAWKPKVCVKRFFGLFLSFFTHKKSLSRTLFCKFSRTARIFHGHFLWFFHAWILCFHGENLDIFRNFHVWVSFFSRVKNEEFQFKFIETIVLTKIGLNIFHVGSLLFSRMWFERNFHVQSIIFTGSF